MTDTLTETRDQSLTGSVEVDGRHFVNCRFEQAELRYSGGALPIFEDCQMDVMTWDFQGAALRTIQLLRAQNRDGHAQDMIDMMFRPGVL